MWRLKMILQFILAYTPWGLELNHMLQRAKGSHSVDRMRVRSLMLARKIRSIEDYKRIQGSRIMDIGTGWTGVNLVLFHVFGAREIYTFDKYPHLKFDLVLRVVEGLRHDQEELAKIGGLPVNTVARRLDGLAASASLQDLLDKTCIRYAAPADATSTDIDPGSVDIVFTYHVFEHVPRKVVHGFVEESVRILTDSGIAFHAIGLGDHSRYASKSVSPVRFLKYPEWIFRLLVKNRISYHNRMRERDFLEILEEHTVEVLSVNHETHPQDTNNATPPDIVEHIRKLGTLDSQFARFTPEELAVCYTEIVYAKS